MIKAILLNIGLVLGLLIGVPFLFIYLLTAINRNTKAAIAERFGIGGQLVFGFLGVIIHEASHLLVALIFGHRIRSVRLLRWPTRDNPTLGYVNHTWRPNNLYQTIGNLFIGIAPVFGCAISTLLLAKWLLPTIYNRLINFTNPTYTITDFSLPAFQWGPMIVFLLLSANICIGGFDLSPSDYQNAVQGLAATILLLGLLAGVASILPVSAVIFTALHQVVRLVATILIFNLVISTLLNLISKIG